MTSRGQRAGTILAFDFGHRRIGVAVGGERPPTASALVTIAARDGQPDWRELQALIAEWDPVLLLVGLPRHADGTDGRMAPDCRAFAGELTDRFGIRTELIDESLSSRAASAELREQRRAGTRRRRVRRGDTDKIAARLVLEHWLATHEALT